MSQPPEEPGYWEQQAAQQPQQPGPPPQPYPGAAYPPPGYGYARPPDHPRSTTALVLGICGLVLCQLLSPFAWNIGKKALAEIDASGGRLGGRGQAQAGYILGVIGSILLGLAVLVVVVFVVLGIGLATTNG